MEGIIARNYFGRYETLQEHIERCIEVGQIKGNQGVKDAVNYLVESTEFKQWLVDEVTLYVVYYHDSGKQTDEFQARITHNLQTKSPHAIHSSAVYLKEAQDRLDEGEPNYPKKMLWVYLLSYVIASHHGDISVGGLYRHEQSLSNYLQKGLYKRLGWSNGQVILDFLAFWGDFDWDTELTLRDFGVIQESLVYLQTIDHEAASQFMMQQLAERLTPEDITSVHKYQQVLQDFSQTYDISIDIREEVKKYMEELVREKKGI